MIKVTCANGIKYIIDGERYWPEEALKEALGCKDDDIFGEIKKLKQERDELKEKCDKLKERTNALHGASCGYSGDKAPAFRCNVISYSWELGSIHDTDSIRVELDLTPNANYKGTFDMEDLRKYIQQYGREKKLGVLEAADYHKAKVARADLAYLYKTVLGKEKLDTNLSPHEVMKAILDEYKRVKDSWFAFSQSLRRVYMHIYEGTGYKTSDVYAAPDKIADWIITRYDSTKNLSHMETICDINDFIDELCDKYNVVRPICSQTTRERLNYIFEVLIGYRYASNNRSKKVEELTKEKRALTDSLAELRAKIREIYRSVVDDEWDEHLSYASALNDINEEHKRVVRNFEERTADWSKAQKEYSRYRLAVGSLLDIPAEHRENISWIEDAFNSTKKDALKWKDDADRLARLRSNICTALCLGHESCDGNIIGRIHMLQDCHDKLCEDYTGLKRGEELLIEFRDSVAKAIGMDYPTTNNFIVKRVSDIYKERGEAHDLAMELDRKCIDLTAKNSELESKWKEQFGLRQMWHVKYESEHERANGVQKALDREREKCRVKDISLETAKKQYEKVCNNLETAECALNGMRSKVRELREEKTKVISAIGQDIWDDCLK